jgi:hypothetical protein
MYKKRLAKWSFRKNSKHSAANAPVMNAKSEPLDAITSITSKKITFIKRLSSVPPSPSYSRHDSFTLMLLVSVRTWSMSFFESLQSPDAFRASQQQLFSTSYEPLPSKAREINFAIKLVISLLDRGHGHMAGMMARKAFFLVEDMLSQEGPALVWNLLELLHQMVTLRHIRLFHMLLAHLTALVDQKMPETHPLHLILRSLRGLVTNTACAVSYNHCISALSPPSHFSSLSSVSSKAEATMSLNYASTLPHTLPSILKKAWILNAEILFDNVDYRLFGLYCGIIWESCSISPPAAIIRAAGQWLDKLETQQMRSISEMAQHAEKFPESVSFVDKAVMIRLLTPRADASPPCDYELLRANINAEFLQRGDHVLSQWASFDGNTSILLPLVSGLVTSKLLESRSTIFKQLARNDLATEQVSRLHAGNLACAIRTLVELDTMSGVTGEIVVTLGIIERIQAVVALSAYAEGETHPLVVQEMLLLRDMLTTIGKYGEAREVEQEAYCRIVSYLQDIPINST